MAFSDFLACLLTEKSAGVQNRNHFQFKGKAKFSGFENALQSWTCK
jgi:hypothetical protein